MKGKGGEERGESLARSWGTIWTSSPMHALLCLTRWHVQRLQLRTLGNGQQDLLHPLPEGLAGEQTEVLQFITIQLYWKNPICVQTHDPAQTQLADWLGVWSWGGLKAVISGLLCPGDFSLGQELGLSSFSGPGEPPVLS